MSWLWKSSSGSQNVQSTIPYAHKQRTKQIESLKETLSGVIEDVRDTQYRVSFFAGGRDLELIILLPLGFPKDPPEVKVSPLCSHPWLSSDGKVTGSPALKNYSIHESMGKVIKQVLDELIANPPVPVYSDIPIQPPYPLYVPFPQATPMMPPIPPHSTSPSQPLYEPVTRRPPPPIPVQTKYQASPVPTEFPEIKEKTDAELKEMIDPDGVILICQMLDKHPVMEKLRKDRETLIEEIERQAESNVAHEPTLQKGWEVLQQSHLELNEWRGKFTQLSKQQMKLSKKRSLASVTAELGKLSLKSETNADAIAEEFLEGKVQSVKFVKSFMEERKLHYLRQAKAKILNSPDQIWTY